ncbi:MAG: RluA family pseudouridine synthase [Asticcacaulis sp.]
MSDTDDSLFETDLCLESDRRLVLTLTADSPDTGTRVDKALAGLAPPDLSRARLQALIEASKVLGPDNRPVSSKEKARSGDYTILIPAPAPAAPVAQALDLPILFEDAHLIVVNKPAGMAAHPAPGTPDGTLVNALLWHCGDSLSGIGGVARPGIVHRLDKDTSGVMVAAKTDAAHAGLSALFSAHTIERTYLALVRGSPRQDVGTLETQIGRSHHDRKKMAILRSGGRTAITHYRVRESYGLPARAGAAPLASLVACTLETGRTHQIRVHMAHLGSPCLGDPTYGAGAPARPVQACLDTVGFSRQALHATVLGFVHPITGAPLRFETPLPEDMAHLQAALRQL